MTVAVGFRCADGIVLAADREVSTPFAKFDGPKAWVYSYPTESSDPILRIGIVGAGDYAFIKFASERIDHHASAWIAQHRIATIDEAIDIVQLIISEIHKQHLYPAGRPEDRPAIDLLVGIWVAGAGWRLVRTSLTAVTNVWNYEAIGTGSDLANFLVRRFYIDQIPISSAMFWASYVLMHAKHYVPGCGGSSDVIAMLDTGAGKIQRETISKYEQFATDFENAIHPIFLSGAASVKQETFMQSVDELSIKLKLLRDPSFIQKQAEQVRRDVTVQLTGASAVGFIGSIPQVLITPTRKPDKDETSGDGDKN
jgi:20S proteasome alpha/beta subunit